MNILGILARILIWGIIVVITIIALALFANSEPSEAIVIVVMELICGLAFEVGKILFEKSKENNAKQIPDDQIKKLSQYIYKNPIKELQVDNENQFLSYKYTKIGLYGRKEECKMLDDFMHCKKKKCIWSIAGHGGMGKSKLAFRLGLNYSKRGYSVKWWKPSRRWNVLWIDRSEIEKLLALETFDRSKKPLLVICDYAGSYTDDIAKLLEKLFNSQKHFRVLLLERTPYNPNDLENWFRKLKNNSHYPARLAEFYPKKAKFNSDSLNLNEVQLGQDDYHCILDDFAASRGNTFSQEQKNAIIDYFREKLCQNQKASVRCLFLLLAADAAMNDNEYRQLDAAALVCNYIERLPNSWETMIENDAKAKQSALDLLALATAGGKFAFSGTYDDIRKEYYEAVKAALPESEHPTETRQQFLAALCERSDRSNLVTPLYPDIIGEYFVVYRYCIDDEKCPTDEWFSVLFTDECRDHFEDFLTRLLSDWDEQANAFIDNAEQWAKDHGKSADRILLAHVYHDVGMQCDDRAEYSRAREYYKKAIVIKEAECGENAIDTAATYNNLGNTYYSMGKYPEAMEWYEKALKIFEAVYGENHPSTAETYNNLGNVYDSMGKYPEALNLYEKALKIYEAVYGENHSSTADTYNNLGIVYQKQGRYTEAVEWYRKALKIKEAVYGKNHPSTADTYNNLGVVYEKQGKYPEAVEWYEKALGIYESHEVYKNHPSTAQTYNNLGSAYDSLGKYPEAVEWYRKALKIKEAVYGKNHPSTADTYNNLGVVYEKQGKYPEAVEWYEKALKIFEAVYGENHPSTAVTYGNFGNVYAKQGEYPEAVEWFEKALKIYEAVYGENHPSTADTYYNLGVLHKKQNNSPQALKYYTKAHTIYQNVYGDNHPETQDALRKIQEIQRLLNKE